MLRLDVVCCTHESIVRQLLRVTVCICNVEAWSWRVAAQVMQLSPELFQGAPAAIGKERAHNVAQVQALSSQVQHQLVWFKVHCGCGDAVQLLA